MALHIGEMIRQLREANKISRDELRRGLVSISELSKIENGEKEPNSFLAAALLQRLGKTINHFELTVTGIEYQLLMLRALIQRKLMEGNLEEAEQALKQYAGYFKSGKTLHQQYMLMIRGVLGYLRSGNKEECMEKLRTAIGLSFSKEQEDNWGGCCFYLQEIQVLILVAYLQMECGRRDEAIGMLYKLSDYIETGILSEDLKDSVYPKCCYLLAKAHAENGDLKQAYEVCGDGIDYLKNKGLLSLLYELLEIRQNYCRDKSEVRVMEALQFLYTFTDNPVQKEDMLKLMFWGETQEVILSNELLKEIRSTLKISQEQLCSEVCARETLSKIENGRGTHQKKLKDLLRKLGVNREKYYGFVEAKEFETYEMVEAYTEKLVRMKWEPTETFFRKLEWKIDSSLLINRQYLEAAKIISDSKHGRIRYKEAVAGLEKCLRYTMPEYDGTIYRIPYKEEFIILNHIAWCRKQSGDRNGAIRMYAGLYDRYAGSEVAPEFHRYPLTMLYPNYVGLLEECGKRKEAERYGREGLELMVRFQRGDVAAFLLKCFSGRSGEYPDVLMRFFRLRK